MATKVQRAKAILDSLADADVGNALALRVANAFSLTYRPGEVLTNEQKAAVFVTALRKYIKNEVKEAEIAAQRAALPPVDDVAIGVD